MKWLKTILRKVIISAFVEGQVRRFDATGLTDETISGRDSFQHYGFASSPQNGAHGIMIGVGNVLYLIAEDDRRYRIQLSRGEVALYTDEGDKIHLKRGKTIDIESGGQVTIKAATSVSIDGGTGNVKGIVQKDCICSFTGAAHPMVSTNVKGSL